MKELALAGWRIEQLRTRRDIAQRPWSEVIVREPGRDPSTLRQSNVRRCAAPGRRECGARGAHHKRSKVAW